MDPLDPVGDVPTLWGVHDNVSGPQVFGQFGLSAMFPNMSGYSQCMVTHVDAGLFLWSARRIITLYTCSGMSESFLKETLNVSFKQWVPFLKICLFKYDIKIHSQIRHMNSVWRAHNFLVSDLIMEVHALETPGMFVKIVATYWPTHQNML